MSVCFHGTNSEIFLFEWLITFHLLFNHLLTFGHPPLCFLANQISFIQTGLEIYHTVLLYFNRQFYYMILLYVLLGRAIFGVIFINVLIISFIIIPRISFNLYSPKNTYWRRCEFSLIQPLFRFYLWSNCKGENSSLIYILLSHSQQSSQIMT